MVNQKVDDQHLLNNLYSCNTFGDTNHLLIRYLLKSAKVDITHLALKIDFQTSDHVVAMQKVAEQWISAKCSVCKSFKKKFIKN